MTPHNLSEPEADRQLEEGAERDMVECRGPCGELFPENELDEHGICDVCLDEEAKAHESRQAAQEALIDIREQR